MFIPPSYFVVDSKVAELHGNGDEIDGTIQLILLKLLLKVNKLLITVRVCVCVGGGGEGGGGGGERGGGGGVPSFKTTPTSNFSHAESYT